MKFSIFLRLAVMVFVAVFLCAKGIAADTGGTGCTLRVVAFSADEREVAGEVPAKGESEDGALYEYFSRATAGGRVEVVSDTLIRVSPGSWTAEAGAEIPYLTEYDIHPGRQQAWQHSADVRNTGVTIKGVLFPGNVCQFTWTRCRQVARVPFPVFSVQTQWPLVMPEYLVDTVAGDTSLSEGGWRLAGIAGETRGGDNTEPGSAPRSLAVFVQVQTEADAATRSHGEAEPRLHLFTFRLPVSEFVPLALDSERDNGALLEHLLARAADGENLLEGHTACLIPREGESGAGSYREIPMVTRYEPDPSGFEYRNAGQGLKIKPLPSNRQDGDRPLVEISWEGTAGPVRKVSFSDPPGFWLPEHAAVAGKLAVPADFQGTVLAGAVKAPEQEDPGMMRLFFCRRAGPAGDNDRKKNGMVETHAWVVSLPAEEGRRPAERTRPPQWDEMKTLLAAGRAHIVSWQTLCGHRGSAGMVRWLTVVPGFTKVQVYPQANGLITAGKTWLHEIGSKLEGRFSVLPESAFEGRQEVDLVRPPAPSPEGLRACAEAGGEEPEFKNVTFASPVKTDTGGAGFRPPVPAPVPANSPEYGRWLSAGSQCHR